MLEIRAELPNHAPAKELIQQIRKDIDWMLERIVDKLGANMITASVVRDFHDQVSIIIKPLDVKLLGICKFRNSIIEIDCFQSRDSTLLTLAHEIAHWFANEVYGDRGHGVYWQMVSRWLKLGEERGYEKSSDGVDLRSVS